MKVDIYSFNTRKFLLNKIFNKTSERYYCNARYIIVHIF